jgi:fructokinase
MMKSPVPNIVCMGEVLWDVLGSERTPGGAPMNVAIHLSRLGHRVAMISRVGKGNYGTALLRFMEKAGVITSSVQVDPDLPTSEVLVSLDDQNNATYEIPHPVAWDRLEFNSHIQQLTSEAELIVFGTLGSRDPWARESIMKALGSPALKLIDVNLRPPYTETPVVQMLLQRAHMAKLNDEELHTLAGWDRKKGKDEIRLMEWLAHRYQLNALVVTRGREGAISYDGSGFHEHPGYPVQVADTVGAGDAFLAGYISSLIRKAGPRESLDFACKTGAYVASHPGGTPDYSMEDIHGIH